ncbi:MAG TPA: Holliday junction branch migration protein RuvA [Halothiobacillaceae bacterium]|nr:Holliday junction branch migration protein RuvA [Halothiobacillaceae bacterium]
MIGQIRGRVLLRTPPVLLVDVGGVGYEVQAPMTTFFATQGQADVVLSTHLVVREDAQLLYGFHEVRDRDLFRELIKVSGIGPRMALAVLSSMRFDEFRDCLAHDDVAALTRVPGIGKKTAERLLIEMRDRLSSMAQQSSVSMTSPMAATDNEPRAEAVAALEALGYKPAEASRLVGKAHRHDPQADAEMLIRLALQQTLPG